MEVTSVRHGGVNIGKKIFTDTNGHENKYFKGKLMLNLCDVSDLPGPARGRPGSRVQQREGPG